MTDQSETSWHLDRKVPIALIIAIAVQTVGIGYWVGGIDNRVTTLENVVASRDQHATRIAITETRVESILEALRSIDSKLDRLVREASRSR